MYAASNLAGNNLFRSFVASGFPLFGHKFYEALGVGGGCSLLAGVSLFMIPMLYVRVLTNLLSFKALAYVGTNPCRPSNVKARAFVLAPSSLELATRRRG